jgi:beta-galactosidase/beta-glucuronidase
MTKKEYLKLAHAIGRAFWNDPNARQKAINHIVIEFREYNPDVFSPRQFRRAVKLAADNTSEFIGHKVLPDPDSNI